MYNKKVILLLFLGVLFYSCNKQFTYIEKPSSKDYGKLFNDFNDQSYVSVEQLKGQFYNYVPCDFIYHKSVMFQENKVTISLGETETYEITKISFNKNIMEHLLTDGYNNGTLLKKKIDDKFLFRFQMNNIDYLFLTISIKDLNKYPLIIHNCKNEKQPEREFEVLDLEEMWNNN
ncbi:hypothetical protein [Paenimyroides marinum]|nr:hypothetical protein [Paenimyroides aquimaris]